MIKRMQLVLRQIDRELASILTDVQNSYNDLWSYVTEARRRANVGANRGDTSITLEVGNDFEYQRFTSALTAGRLVTLSTVNAARGDRFTVVKTNTAGAGALDVGGLATIPAGKAGFVEVMYDGSAWVVTSLSI